jgi:hypothetical protein
MTTSLPAGDVKDLSRPDLLGQFLLAPFHPRSYTNLIYLLLALPLGLVDFTFVITGLSLSAGLMITILGLPVLGLTLLGSWWLSALERRLAIGLLGAEVPPMGPTPFRSGQGFKRDLEDFLGNRVTWTGTLYLGLKLPLGVISFAMVVTLVAFSLSFLLVPFLYPLSFIQWDNDLLWWVDTPGEAALCFLVGLLFTYSSLLLLNGLAALWKVLSVAMLGSTRHAAPSLPAPLEPEAPAEMPAVTPD